MYYEFRALVPLCHFQKYCLHEMHLNIPDVHCTRPDFLSDTGQRKRRSEYRIFY